MSVNILITDFFNSEAKEYTLQENRVLKIGRSSKCDVVLLDEMCSAKHCSITLKGELATIRDLDSHNGTLLNDTKIQEAHIYLGDIVKIGRCTLKLNKKTMTPEEMKMHLREKLDLAHRCSHQSRRELTLPGVKSKKTE